MADALRDFEDYLNSVGAAGDSIEFIYDMVQGCVEVLPRVYLMCSIGGVYISRKQRSVKEVLNDLIQMIKAIQHPVRGLFVRYYLCQVTKNKLPDAASYEGAAFDSSCTVQDSMNFLLQNFVESNKLWVRMQSQGTSKDRKKREKERQDLCLLVGTNIDRLSRLEGLNVAEYTERVLPLLIEQIVNCKDTISQTYLADIIIQVFPDEFHLNTLDQLLSSVTKLKEKVNVRSILESFMARLTNYFTTCGRSIDKQETAPLTPSSSLSSNTSHVFDSIRKCVADVIRLRTSMTLADALQLQTALLSFASQSFPSHLNYVESCLENSIDLLANENNVAPSSTPDQLQGGGVETSPLLNREPASEAAVQTQLEGLLLAPLSALGLKVLDMKAYPILLSYLPWKRWKEVALVILKSALRGGPEPVVIQDASHLQRLLSAVAPIFSDIPPSVKGSRQARTASRRGEGAGTWREEEGGDFGSPVIIEDGSARKEQVLVSRLVYILRADDADALLDMYVALRDRILAGADSGGVGSKLAQSCLPSILFALLALCRRYYLRGDMAVAISGELEPSDMREEVGSKEPSRYGLKTTFQIVLQTLAALALVNPTLALKIYLEAFLVSRSP